MGNWRCQKRHLRRRGPLRTGTVRWDSESPQNVTRPQPRGSSLPRSKTMGAIALHRREVGFVSHPHTHDVWISKGRSHTRIRTPGQREGVRSGTHTPLHISRGPSRDPSPSSARARHSRARSTIHAQASVHRQRELDARVEFLELENKQLQDEVTWCSNCAHPLTIDLVAVCVTGIERHES